MMFSNFALIIELSLTDPHVPDKAQTNMHQILYMVSIRLILVITWNKKDLSKNVVPATSTLAEKFLKLLLLSVCVSFFSDRAEQIVLCFNLYEPSLHF